MSYDPNQPYEQVPYSDPYYQPSPSPQPQQPPQAPPSGYPTYAQPSFYTQQPVQPPPLQPQPPYMPPQPMPPYMAPPQPKKSRRWLWITLGIIGGVLLLSCAGCAIVFGQGFGAVKQVIGPSFVTGEYYQYLKEQDYARAYSFVDSNATITVNGQSISNDLQSFTTAAENQDTQLGVITNFSVTTNGSDLSQLIVVVTRQGGQAYDVHLTFSQVGGTTKIASMDGI
jgi:hypothetical protein